MSEKALKPCPFCGSEGKWVEASCSTHFVACADEAKCWSEGPARNTPAEAIDAWNALPRLADGLRPEAAKSAESGFALLDEAARHALEDTAETVLWLRRAVTALAERHGVKLPPAPGRVRRAL